MKIGSPVRTPRVLAVQGPQEELSNEASIRPSLGDGLAPQITDLVGAVRLSRLVQLVAAVLAVSAACRSGRRVSPLW